MRDADGRLTIVGWLRIGGFVAACLVIGVLLVVLAHPRPSIYVAAVLLGAGAGFRVLSRRR